MKEVSSEYAWEKQRKQLKNMGSFFIWIGLLLLGIGIITAAFPLYVKFLCFGIVFLSLGNSFYRKGE